MSGFSNLGPIELASAEWHERNLRTSERDDVHGLQLDGARGLLLIHGNDVRLSKVWDEQERPIVGIVANVGLRLR